MEGFAEDLALDTGRFSACMEARTYDGVIQRDINLALRNEVSVTPTIFVLPTDPNQTGTKFDGSPSFEEISAVIDELLMTQEPGPSPELHPRQPLSPPPLRPRQPPRLLCLHQPPLRSPPTRQLQSLLPYRRPPQHRHQLQSQHPDQPLYPLLRQPQHPALLLNPYPLGVVGTFSALLLHPSLWRNSATFNEAPAGIGPLDRPKR